MLDEPDLLKDSMFLICDLHPRTAIIIPNKHYLLRGALRSRGLPEAKDGPGAVDVRHEEHGIEPRCDLCRDSKEGSSVGTHLVGAPFPQRRLRGANQLRLHRL